MKTRIVTLLIVACAHHATAQLQLDQTADIISQGGTVSVMPLYQRWSLQNAAFSEASSVLTLYQPLGRSASVSLRGAYGSASGDITSLSGLADMELTGNYYIESADLILGLGVGLPSGKKKLTRNEFLTTLLISNNVFRLQVPHFGEGLRIAPSIVWALPVTDVLVVGLGASFQYRGAFSPLENFGSYDPGEEVSGTIGFDARVSETASIAGDVVYTHYGKDKVDGLEVFAPGAKVMAVAQYTATFDHDELAVMTTYRTRAKPDVAVGNLLTPLKDRIEPNQGEIKAGYTFRFSDEFAANISVEGRFFEKTSAPFSGMTLLGVGIVPEYSPGGNVAIPLRLQYFRGTGNGTMSGIEAGLGISVSY